MDIEEEFEISLSKLFILLEVIPDDLRYKIELRYNSCLLYTSPSPRDRS